MNTLIAEITKATAESSGQVLVSLAVSAISSVAVGWVGFYRASISTGLRLSAIDAQLQRIDHKLERLADEAGGHRTSLAQFQAELSALGQRVARLELRNDQQ
jgi:hypothetical protein